ncbi:MAG: hypothetical protein ABSD39_17360 [Terriglobales bacterium]|jgi:hypothetical protein
MPEALTENRLPGEKPSLSSRLAGIVLPDSESRPVRLGSLWENGPAVIAFLRHYG